MEPTIREILQQMLDSINANRPSKRIMTVDELTKYLGLSKSTIYKLTHQRIIPHCKLPGRRSVFFRKSAIDKWIEENPVPTRDLLFEKALFELKQQNKKK